MIQPINSISYCRNFRGKVKETLLLRDSINNFSEKELTEFNALKTKAAKVHDGKEFTIYKSAKQVQSPGNVLTKVYTIGVLDENNEFLSSEIYKRVQKEEVKTKTSSEDSTAFARAILNPLRELYANVKI